MATLWKKQSCTVLSVPGNLGQFKLSKHLWIIFFHALSALKRSTQLRISLVKYIFIFYQPSSSSLLKLPIYMVLQNPRDIFHKCANKYFFLRIEILIQFNHYYTATLGETDGSRFIKVWFSYPPPTYLSVTTDNGRWSFTVGPGAFAMDRWRTQICAITNQIVAIL